jgi:hypothetical protein
MGLTRGGPTSFAVPIRHLAVALAAFFIVATSPTLQARETNEPRFLADKPNQPAYAYLQRLQQIANMRPSRLAKMPSKDEIQRFFAEQSKTLVALDSVNVALDPKERARREQELKVGMLKEIDAIMPLLPTPYTDWRTYILTRRIALKIEAAILTMGHKVDTARIGNPTARRVIASSVARLDLPRPMGS